MEEPVTMAELIFIHAREKQQTRISIEKYTGLSNGDGGHLRPPYYS